MPIPSLPLDIIFEIVSHLEEEDEEKISQQIEQGKMVSLVCKSWRTLGQGLRWRTVNIEPQQLPSLLDHFVRFPHLTKLVRLFTFIVPIMYDLETLHAPDRETTAQLSQFLSTLVNLQDLSISGNLEEDLVPALRAASSLENLRYLNMRDYGQFTCSNEFSTSLQTGFKKLQTLGFAACGRTTVRHDDIEEPVSSKLSVSQATIGLFSEPSETPQLANDFLSIFDPVALTNVCLQIGAACSTSIQYLSNCPNLTELSLDLINFSGFSQLLPHFPHFPSLEACRVRVIGGEK